MTWAEEDNMEDFALAVFAVAVIALPIALLLLSQQGKKRGCGRGCSSCGNRDICWRGDPRRKEREKRDD